MLGLGSSVNSEEGYAKGERYRERFNEPIGTYHATTNAVGLNGYTYIGAMADSNDTVYWSGSNINMAVVQHAGSGTFNVSPTSNNGYAYISFSAVPGVAYTITVDITSVASGTKAWIYVGHADDIDAYDTVGNITSGSLGTKTLTFTTSTSYTVGQLSIGSTISTKAVRFDNVSLKES